MKDILMMIIKMVDDGKITADEGVKLINAVNSTAFSSYEAARAMKNKVKGKVDGFVKDAQPKVKSAAEKIKRKTDEVADGISKGINSMKEKRAAAAADEAAEEAEDMVDEPLIDVSVEDTGAGQDDIQE